MAVTDHHDLSVSSNQEERHCALMFCLTWVGFFVLIGVVSYLVSSI